MEGNTDLEHVDSPKNQVIFVFLEYLQQLKNEGKMTEDTLESVEVAMQCLSSSFGVELNDEDARKKYSIQPHSLPTVLGLGLAGKEKLAQALEKMKQRQSTPSTSDTNDIEYKFFQYITTLKKKGFFNGVTQGSSDYEQRYIRAREKFHEKFLKPATTTSQSTPMDTDATPPQPSVEESLSPAEKLQAAEKHKMEGNQKLSDKQYAQAAESYSKAILLNPENAIYYANRAAAYSHLGLHEKAIEDCKISIQKNPSYSKAYGRLGLAYFSLGKYKEAVEAYRKGLELDPTSQALKESLSAAEQKLKPESTTTTTTPPPSGNTGTPNLNDLLNNPALRNMMGGGNTPGNTGSGPNLNDLLNNPMLSSMAEQMMNNPQMMSMAQNLMQNPEALNNLMRSFGGGNR